MEAKNVDIVLDEEIVEQRAGWNGNSRDLGLIVVTVHEEIEKGWWLSTSHGEPPRGFYATLVDAQKAAERHARAQLERTLSLLTAAEDLPRGGARPRACGVVLLYADEDIAAKRKQVLTALTEVS